MPNSPEYQICKAFIEQADRIEKLNEECNNLAITVDSMAEELIKNKGQADRISELEGEVATLKHINKNWSISEGWALQRVAELEKQLAFMEGEYPEPTIAEKMTEFKDLEQAFKRIAELEKELQNSALNNLSAMAQADEHYARVQELEKQVKHWTTPCQPLCKPSVCDCITPPTRQLSDEEMMEVIEQVECTYNPVEIETSYDYEMRIARAIEAKLKGQ
jgi:chromosome segregation ATPase